MLVQPAVAVGRSPEWQGRHDEGAVLAARWNFPLVQEVSCAAEPLPWHEAHSPIAAPAAWSNCTLAGRAALAAVKSACGREFAWQSTHDPGCAWLAADSEEWNGEVVVHRWAITEGAWWQRAHSAGTTPVAVGRPFTQWTASCFISPEAGVLAGFVAVGPTKPAGTEVRWQSRHSVGCASFRNVRDACIFPGKKTPAFAPAWQFAQLLRAAADSPVAWWFIGIGSASVRALTLAIEVPE